MWLRPGEQVLRGDRVVMASLELKTIETGGYRVKAHNNPVWRGPGAPSFPARRWALGRSREEQRRLETRFAAERAARRRRREMRGRLDSFEASWW